MSKKILMTPKEQRKLLDDTLNHLSDELTVLLAIDPQFYTYDRCCLLRQFSIHFRRLTLRNNRIRRSSSFGRRNSL